MPHTDRLAKSLIRLCALVLTLFLFQKGQGIFPPLPTAALAPAVGVGRTQALQVGMEQCNLDIFAALINGPVSFFIAGVRRTQALLIGMFRCGLVFLTS